MHIEFVTKVIQGASLSFAKTYICQMITVMYDAYGDEYDYDYECKC